MFCKKCGKQIPDDANFCPYCGEHLNGCSPVKKSSAATYIIAAGIAIILIIMGYGAIEDCQHTSSCSAGGAGMMNLLMIVFIIVIIAVIYKFVNRK